jgi:hypothetical protein
LLWERSSGESVLDAFGRFVTQPRGFLAAEDEETKQAIELLRTGLADYAVN